jgi:predicted phosphodiesterase
MPKIYSEQFKRDLRGCVEAHLSQGDHYKHSRKAVKWEDIQSCMLAVDTTYIQGKEQLRHAYIKMTGGTLKAKAGQAQDTLPVKRDIYRNRYRDHTQTLLEIISTHKASLPHLMEVTKLSDRDILGILTQLQFTGYPNITIWQEHGVLQVQNFKKQPLVTEDAYDFTDKYEGREISFMVVSDTHIGSDKSRLDALHWVYRHAYDLGIREVYHAGDITDGFYTNRMTSIKEQDAVGFQEQLTLVKDHYPHIEGMTTYYITGNHDITHMRNGFADLGETLEMVRPDMVYLGHNYAKVYLTENTTLALIHPTDGSASTLSLKLQKLIDNNPKRKADLMFVGHYHKSLRMKYKGSYGFLVPSFQDQTSFMLDNNLVSDVGATIIQLKLDHDGRIIALHDTYIDLSDMGGVHNAYEESSRE